MQPADAQLRDALEPMILSASGWRKVFAVDGEHGSHPLPSPEDQLLAVGMGVIWGRSLTSRATSQPHVLVATDTRPTGPVLAEMVMRGLEHSGCRTVYAGAAAAPEAMARSGRDGGIHGLAYISASHNPLGHNGIKFGVLGGVLAGNEIEPLIAEYRKLICGDGAGRKLLEIAGALFGRGKKAEPRPADPVEKKRCLEIYDAFLREIAGGSGPQDERDATLAALRRAIVHRPVRVVADLNGSARSLSADRSFLNALGVEMTVFNDEPGRIAHAILPEGASLEPCRLALEKAHARDPAAFIGYVPDNDGDRGNLVIWDEALGKARILEAQEVFALSTLAEFSAGAWTQRRKSSGSEPHDTALVVNGPTSHRVRLIAAAYGVEVHEAEVGEANLVGRAEELRKSGYRVRLFGEGSNGGVIIHPSGVRDPMNTVAAILKLLRLPSTPENPGPFHDWCLRIGRGDLYRDGFGPSDLASSLPVFTTTPASAPRAVMTIQAQDHGALKAAWETIFRRQWCLYKEDLTRAYGFVRWEEINNEGTESRRGTGPEHRRGRQSGGLKVVFSDSSGEDAGFLWMRGSGTEPVFRVMAEIRGSNPAAERALMMWHRGMVAAADRQATNAGFRESSIPPPVRN